MKFEWLRSRVDIGDCWVWTAGRGGANADYGRAYYEGRNQPAHRVVWEALVGSVGEGLQLDHLCRNRLCVNPDHLEVVTPTENRRRGYNDKYSGRKKVSHCKHGHEYTEENTYSHPDGYRGCLTCRTRQSREYRVRSKEAHH